MINSKLFTLLTHFSLCLFLVPIAHAGGGEDWEYRFTPYVWLPSLKTDLEIGRRPSVESETDLLDVLDMAFLATGEIRRDDDALLLEFNYLKLSDSVSFFQAGRFGADVSVKGVMGSVAWARRVETQLDGDVDLFAGARFWDLDFEIDYRRLPAAKISKDWVDPIIGVRGSTGVAPAWRVNALADIGGFGIGSEFQWEVMLEVERDISDLTAVSFGYRHLDLKFKGGSVDLDAAMSGPYVAVDFRW
jgi:hypothetical protein